MTSTHFQLAQRRGARGSIRSPDLVVCVVVAGILLSMTSFGGVPAVAAEPDLARGERVFKKCIHCHTVDRTGRHRIGPNLFGMFGRKAGGLADFEYSEAWKKADFVWSDSTLDEYLKAPHKMIPNNRMPFDGLPREADRAALIAYLKTVTTP